MKQAPQRGVKDILKDLESLQNEKGGDQRQQEIEENTSLI